MPSNNKQESDYSRQTINKKGLRTGYTTGSCAAAASKAALSCLLTKEIPKQVTILLPVGETATFNLKIKLPESIEYEYITKEIHWDMFD